MRLIEMTHVTGVKDPVDGAAAIRELGVRFAIVTGGAPIGTIHSLGAQDAARLGAALGALATTTIDTFTGPEDPAAAWEMAGLQVPR